MNILALRSYMNFMSKLILLIVFAFQIIAFNSSNASADSKNALLGTASDVIADIAEKRITSIVNISSTKVIKTQQSQQNNPLFNDPFFQHFFGQGFFNIPVDHLSALPLFARYFKKNLDLKNLVVVSPDAGGTYRARELSKRLNCSLAIGDKRRIGNDDNAEILNIIGDVENKDVLIFDDILDTAGSITRLAKAVKGKGARKVYAACVHGVLSGNATEKLQNSVIEKVFITDSISQDDCDCKKIEQITIAELLAMAIKKIHIGESLSILFR